MGKEKKPWGIGGNMGGIVFVSFLILAGCRASIVHSVGNQVIDLMDKAWTQVKDLDRSGKGQKAMLIAVGKSISPIPPVIGRIEKEMQVYEYDDALKSLSKVKNTTASWRDKWNEINVLSSPVDILYGHFRIFPDMPEAFVPGSRVLDLDATSLSDLILKPLYNSDANGTLTLKFLVENAHQLSIGSGRLGGRKNALLLLNDHIEESLQQSYWCLWNAKTPQRLVYGLYTSLSLLDLKEFTLINFAYMLRYVLNGTDWTTTSELADEAKLTLQRRLVEKATTAKKAFAKTSSAYWRCDPIKHEEGQTFEQFQELLQGYIENEKNMHHTGSCKQSCNEYNFVKAYCPYPDPANCHRQRICTGNLVDCKFVAADATVCPADGPRRFDYIQYKKGPTFGSTSGRCSKETVKKDSFWRFLYHCSNCFCLCDDPDSPTTVRHVSLAPVTSDVSANKIVTGVKFAMKDDILHLQIEEGLAAKDGLAVGDSTVWKPVPTIDKHDKTKAAVLFYTQRSIDLDDLIAPHAHVITGVKFRMLGNHVNLEIQGTQINPDTGNLIPDTSHWISNDNTPESSSHSLPSREELFLEDPDIPTNTIHPSVPDSVHDQYVQFGPSSHVKDVAQTTVPFIDIQPVRPSPAVWLKGVGIYHKGQWGYGGFVAPRVFTHSAADFIDF